MRALERVSSGDLRRPRGLHRRGSSARPAGRARHRHRGAVSSPAGVGRRLRIAVGVRLASTRQAFENPNLGRLLLVWGVWVTTDWALLITVSVLALELGGPAAVGLVGVVRVLPTALLTGPASILADRWPRGRLLATSNLGWAVVSGLL